MAQARREDALNLSSLQESKKRQNFILEPVENARIASAGL
jgi:hypothetical protein